MRTPFVKLSGAGNDFVLFDERKARYKLDWAAATPGICDRRNGVGADGIVLLRPSSSSDFEVVYFNADGSPGSMCGNGARCAVRYAAGEGALSGKTTFKFTLAGRPYNATLVNDQITLDMTDPTEIRLGVSVTAGDRSLRGHSIDTGTPHFVLFASDAGMDPEPASNSAAVLELGRAIRLHAMFKPRGTNVNFLWPGPDPGSIRIRTFEKGVEDETFSCGTGAVASAVIQSLVAPGAARHVPSGDHERHKIAVIPRSGETSIVEFTRDGDRISRVRLTGPARETFRGSVELDG